MSRWIRCRFCEWKCPAFFTTGRGRKVHGYFMLENHCLAQHEDILKKYGLLIYRNDDEFDQFSNNLIERR